jgi:hypothetical protein
MIFGYLKIMPNKNSRKIDEQNRKDVLLNALSLGMPTTEACRFAGIDKVTFYNWQNESPENKKLIEKTRASFIEKNLKIIQEAAEKRTWQAACWLLERRAPEEFSQIAKTPDDGKLDSLVTQLEGIAKERAKQNK